jgi:hypothetical protein
MAYGQIDPARLDGDALTRWYLRSPTDIEQERQADAAQRYADFLGVDRAAQEEASTAYPSPSELGDSQLGQDEATHGALAPYGDARISWGNDGAFGGGTRVAEAFDPTKVAPAIFEPSLTNGTIQVAGGAAKDQCIEQCTPLLERPPRGDRNQWDFHKCLNACMDRARRSSPNSSPVVPARPSPTPSPVPWWMWIPRLLPEAAPFLA